MKFVLPVLIAAFVAFVLGWVASSAFRARAVTTSERAPTRADPQKAPVPVVEQPVATTEANASPTPLAESRTSEGLISAALNKYAHEEIDAGWHETRKDPLPEPLLTSGYTEFEQAVRKLPREIGRQLAQKQGQIERLAGDDPFAAMDALNEGELGPQFAIVQDEKAFSRFFACAEGPRVDGIALIQDKGPTSSGVQPGSTIFFPDGVHDLRDLARLLGANVRCVTIVGNGMDRTLLRASHFAPSEKLDRLEFRDCTFECPCSQVDLRKAGVWRAERVRFVGFDCGAGSSCVFSAMSGAIVELKSCRIEGGYGRHPEHGMLFDVRSNAFLARFEDCTIDSLQLRHDLWRKGFTLLLTRCRFTNLLDGRLPIDRDDDGVLMISTTMELRPKDAGEVQKRDLADLFPAWLQPTKR